MAPIDAPPMTVSTCGLTRLLLVGLLVGTVVSSLTGSDVVGGLAALVAIAVVAVVQRVRGTANACAVETKR